MIGLYFTDFHLKITSMIGFSLYKILSFAFFVVLSLSTSLAHAHNCSINKKTQIIFIPGGVISTPLDTPAGTILYEDTFPSVNAPTTVTCESNQYYTGFKYGPAISVLGSTKGDFLFGKTGLSLSIYRDGYKTFPPTYFANEPGSTSFVDNVRQYKVRIFKSSGTPENNTIPAGSLGSIIYDAYDLVTFILASPISLNLASCQAPGVSVYMGEDYKLSEFEVGGSTSRPVKFSISLNQCKPNINKITYSFRATTQVIDQQKGVVALNNGSTAKGIGLQLLDDAGHAVALNTTYPFTAFSGVGSSFSIPFSAAYYRLPSGKLEAGTANTDVTFIMSYL